MDEGVLIRTEGLSKRDRLMKARDAPDLRRRVRMYPTGMKRRPVTVVSRFRVPRQGRGIGRPPLRDIRPVLSARSPGRKDMVAKDRATYYPREENPPH